LFKIEVTGHERICRKCRRFIPRGIKVLVLPDTKVIFDRIVNDKKTYCRRCGRKVLIQEIDGMGRIVEKLGKTLSELYVPFKSKSRNSQRKLDRLFKRMGVAASVVQWLGSPVGWSFLERCVNKCGYNLVRKS